MSPEYEAANADVEAALRGCYHVVCGSMEKSETALDSPPPDAVWINLVAALERHADLARECGERPKLMIARLKKTLETTLPPGELAEQFREVVVAFSIQTYFKRAS
jgi:hypothetical protein